MIKAIEAWFANGCVDRRAALLEAGYAETTAKQNPDKVFKHPLVVAEIERRRKEEFAKYDLSKERLLHEAAKAAYMNFGDVIVKLTDHGFDLRCLTAEERAVIGSVEVDVYWEGKGEFRRKVKKFKIKPVSKGEFAQMLARMQGYNQDNLKLEGEVSMVERLRKGRERLGKKDDGASTT